eukprot:518485-Pyramimonas_sp.AAC.1
MGSSTRRIQPPQSILAMRMYHQGVPRGGRCRRSRRRSRMRKRRSRRRSRRGGGGGGGGR